jgi:hypothetical protein
MLTNEERERLVEEEKLRADVRKSLEKNDEEKNPFFRVIKSDNFRWIITAFAIPATVFIWSEYEKAKDNAEREHVQETETAQHNIDLVIKLLPAISKKVGDSERENAFIVIKTLEDRSQLPRTLRAAIEARAADLRTDVKPDGAYSTPGGVRDSEALSSSNPTSEDISNGYIAPSSIVVPGAKAFMQIFNDSQRAQAEQLQSIARSIGVAAPGVENVVITAEKRHRKPPAGYDVPTLLVFKESDKEIASKLAKEVEDQAKLKLEMRSLIGNPAFGNVPAGQLEIWFPNITLPKKS